MRYPGKFEMSKTGGVLVTFRDFPDLDVTARDYDSAMDEAQKALIREFQAFMEKNMPIPMPSELNGEEAVLVATSAWVRVLLYNAIWNSSIQKEYLTPGVVELYTSLDEPANLTKILSTLRGFGKELILHEEIEYGSRVLQTVAIQSAS